MPNFIKILKTGMGGYVVKPRRGCPVPPIYAISAWRSDRDSAGTANIAYFRDNKSAARELKNMKDDTATIVTLERPYPHQLASACECNKLKICNGNHGYFNNKSKSGKGK